MIKKLAYAAIAGGVFLLAPAQAQAQVSLGPTLAYHDDGGDLGVGAMVTVPMPALAEGVGFMGDFTYFFPDDDPIDIDYWELNGNLTWDIPVESPAIAPFLLGGLNIAHASVGGVDGADNTEVGLNLGAGLRFPTGTIEPLVGGRFELDGGEGFVIFAALPFSLGG